MVSEAFLRAFKSNLAKCQSPVERMLLEATLLPDSGLLPSHAVGPSPVYKVAFSDAVDFFGENAEISIVSQADPLCDGERPVIHCDFEFRWSGEYSADLYVEIDGHRWHEKTQAQASRDRARDRRIARSSGKLVRYTAVDVMTDACFVIRDITDTLYAMEVDLDCVVGVISSRGRDS